MRRLSRREILTAGHGLAVTTAAAALVGCGAGPAPDGVSRVSQTVPAVAEEPSPAMEQVAEATTVVNETAVPVDTVVPDETPRGAAPSGAARAAYLAVARGPSPAAITEAAIRAIGGIERFVKAGDDVIVKPNICVAYHGPEYAATTNPEVVAAVVRLCKAAGARRVRVMDYPFGGTAREAYVKSGIRPAVEAVGGEMELMSRVKYAEVEFPPESRDIRKWVVYEDALKADVIINVPIAKHHSLAILTLGGKNLMGLIDKRNLIHVNLHQRIADLVALFRPQLTIMDAVRILMAHGPSGGSLDDVKEMNTVIASHDIVAVDAYTTRFFPFADTEKVAYIKCAAEMGLGTLDVDAVRVEEITM